MSMISGKDELQDTGRQLQSTRDLERKMQEAIAILEAKNRTSRAIMTEEGTLALETCLESGKIDGRFEAIRVIAGALGVQISY